MMVVVVGVRFGMIVVGKLFFEFGINEPSFKRRHSQFDISTLAFVDQKGRQVHNFVMTRQFHVDIWKQIGTLRSVG